MNEHQCRFHSITMDTKCDLIIDLKKNEKMRKELERFSGFAVFRFRGL